MNWLQLILGAVGYFLAGAPLSYTFGSYTITAVDNTKNAPAHMTFAQVEQAILKVLAGQEGSFVSGDITITVTKS